MVRKPTIYDLGKATKLLTDKEGDQDKILFEWLRLIHADDGFFSLVNIDRKKVTGLLTCVYNVKDTSIVCTIGKLVGEHEIKELLLKKLQKDLDPSIIYILTTENKNMEELGFNIENYTMKFERNDK